MADRRMQNVETEIVLRCYDSQFLSYLMIVFGRSVLEKNVTHDDGKLYIRLLEVECSRRLAYSIVYSTNPV